MMEQQHPTPAFEEMAIQDLVLRLRGTLLRPGDADYAQAARVYNGMIEKRPALIAHCVDVADVIAAVNFAREHELALAVRGGGHSGPGLGTCDDGLVIDLSGMKGIRVDPSARTVRVEGGCTWGEVDHATHPFGLATPSGFVSSTGVGGLTLGGGIGYLSRTHGLTIDNLLGVDVVLANGSLLRPAPPSMLTCSGQYAVVAATSVSSPHFSTSCTPSAQSMAGRCSGRSNRQQTS